jgi:ferrous iron transport protein B
MELPPYHMPRLKDVFIHSWIRLKSFIFGAGKMIVMVIVVLSFLNSFGANGSFGNEDSDKSALSAIGRAIVPAFAPMGIREDNWPATVGLFTGIFAKEAVVGTLDSLYSGLGETSGKKAGTDKPEYDLLGSLGKAVASIGANLAALGDLLGDPLGIGIVRTDSQGAAAKAQAVSAGTFGAMVQRFDGKIGAFAYLLFLLLYFPCVAAMGAVKAEAGPRWAVFTGLWTTGLAYTVSVIFYQAATFLRHPGGSLLWIGALSGLMMAFVFYLRWLGHANRPAPDAPVAE